MWVCIASNGWLFKMHLYPILAYEKGKRRLQTHEHKGIMYYIFSHRSADKVLTFLPKRILHHVKFSMESFEIITEFICPFVNEVNDFPVTDIGQCPICHRDNASRMILTECGHGICGTCASMWFITEGKHVCHMCRSPVSVFNFTDSPVTDLSELMQRQLQNCYHKSMRDGFYSTSGQ